MFYGRKGFDIDENKNWLAVIKKEISDQENSDQLLLAYKNLNIKLPVSWKFPIARFLNDTAIIVNSRIQKERELNAIIIRLDNGNIIQKFTVGDGVNDIAVLQDYIAVSYFDEGVFSNTALSSQGLAFFNFKGEYQYGYRENVPGHVDIADCYAICKVEENKLAFCAYTDFEFIQLNVSSKSQEIYKTPKQLHGAHAITLKQNTAFFKGPYQDKEANQQTLFAYNLETKSIKAIGIIPGQYARGLPQGKFLSYCDGNIIISSVFL